MNINREEIVINVATIKETIFNSELNDAEKLIILSNLILDIAKVYLPSNIKDDATNILNNGRRIGLELQIDPYNLGLQLALNAHLIVDIASSLND